MKVHVSLVAAVWMGLVAGCGGSAVDAEAPEETPAPEQDAGGDHEEPPTGDAGKPDAEPAADHGAPSDTYPAFKPDMPKLQYNGGALLRNPVVVTVTFPGDPHAAEFEAFGDALGDSAYWEAGVKEYGIGATTSGPANHVRVTTPLGATMTDADLDDYVKQAAGDPATSGWPAPTDDTVYVLYLPPATGLNLQGADACSSGVGGYHTSVAVAGKQVAYAIIPVCSNFGLPAVDQATIAASHEIGEAATDAHPLSDNDLGYWGVDDAHLAWTMFMQFNVENGDLCEVFEDSSFQPTEPALSSFFVQRLWSNASAKAGHDPCVPAPDAPYFNVVPLDTEPVTVNLFGGQKVNARGYEIAVGETRSFSVGLYSDGPMEAWTIDPRELNLFSQSKVKHLDLSVDEPTGQNGNKAVVTVTVNSAGKYGGEIATIVSRSNDGRRRFMPILIASP